jgi:hypothetical protein
VVEGIERHAKAGHRISLAEIEQRTRARTRADPERAAITTTPTPPDGRVALSEETIADYGAAMLEGVKFPPCIVFADGGAGGGNGGAHARWSPLVRVVFRSFFGGGRHG